MATYQRRKVERPPTVVVATALMTTELVLGVVSLAWTVWDPDGVLPSSRQRIGVLAHPEALPLPLLCFGFGVIVIALFWRGRPWTWAAALGIAMTLLYGRFFMLGSGIVIIGWPYVVVSAAVDVAVLVVMVLPSIRTWINHAR